MVEQRGVGGEALLAHQLLAVEVPLGVAELGVPLSRHLTYPLVVDHLASFEKSVRRMSAVALWTARSPAGQHRPGSDRRSALAGLPAHLRRVCQRGRGDRPGGVAECGELLGCQDVDDEPTRLADVARGGLLELGEAGVGEPRLRAPATAVGAAAPLTQPARSSRVTAWESRDSDPCASAARSLRTSVRSGASESAARTWYSNELRPGVALELRVERGRQGHEQGDQGPPVALLVRRQPRHVVSAVVLARVSALTGTSYRGT